MAWATQEKKGWRGRYRDASGRSRSAGYAPTERKAIKLARDQEAKIRGDVWFDPSAGAITFSDYFENLWLPNRMGEVNTLATYESHYNASLKDEFGHMELRKILPSQIQGWVKRQTQEARVSPGTIKARLKALQTVLAAKRGVSALNDKFIQTNPCAAIQLPAEVPREVKIFDPVQVEALGEALDEWWLPLLAVAIDTGMRWGELMGLQVDHFTLGFKSVYVRQTIIEVKKDRTGEDRFSVKPYPKNRRPRHLALSPEVGTCVAEMVAARGLGPGDRLFSMPDKTPPAEWHPPLTLEWTVKRTEKWPNGLPLGRSYFRESVWVKALDKAELPRRRFHDLRASNISWMLGGNADVSLVMERVGHEEFSTTHRYQQVLEEADTRAVDALAAVRLRFGAR